MLGVAALVAALVLARPWDRFGATEGGRLPGSASLPRPEASPTPLDAARGRLAAREGAVADAEVGAGGLPLLVDLETVDRDLDLHGTVVDGAGAPIAGADLQTVTYPFRRASLLAHDRYDEAVAGPRARSAKDGTFVVRLRRGEVVALRVAATGFAAVERPSCRAGERVHVVLHPGVTLIVEASTPEGRPAAGAGFRLSRRGSSDGVAFVRTGTTDADGRLRLEGLPPDVGATLESEASALGHTGWQDVQLPASGESVVRVAFRAGRTITGRVTDAQTSAPIPRALVGMNWTLDRSVTTGADGRYVLLGWTGVGIRDIHVLAEGYGRAQALVGTASVLDFALSRGDSVVGRVVGPDGAPIGGAVVAAIGSVRRDDVQVTSSAEGTTTADGRFVLSGLRRDLPHALVVMAVDFGRTLVDFDPRAEGPGTIDLGDVVVPRGRTISGRVLAHDGTPVPQARLELLGGNADRGRLRAGGKPIDDNDYGATEEGQTDDAGRFAFPDLAPGTYELETWTSGMSSQRATVRVPDDADPPPLEIRFSPGRRVRVVVVDDAGVPVPSAFVFVEGGSGPHNEVARLDSQGAVTLLLSDSVKSVQVTTWSDRGPDARRFLDTDREFPVDPKATEVRCVLVRGRALRGRVLGPDGAPVANAGVEVRSGESPVSFATTDDEGRFDATVPRDGALTVRLEGWAGTGGATRELGLAGEAEWTGDAAEVVVNARAAARDLRQAVVVQADGRPVAGAKVVAKWARGAMRSPEVVTGADGRAELTGLPEVVCSWWATPPGDATDFVASYGGSTIPSPRLVTVSLRKGVRVHGRIGVPADAAGSPVRVEVAQSQRTTTTVVGPGETTFSMLLDPEYGESGSVAAHVGPEGATRHVARVDVARFGEAEIVLSLEPVK